MQAALAVYTSIAFTDRLVEERIDPSVGSVGDAYDCQSVPVGMMMVSEVLAVAA